VPLLQALGARLGSRDLKGMLLRGAGAAFLVQITGGGLKYLQEMLFARWAGAEAFGSYIYAVNWAILLSLPAGLGLTVAVLRFVPGYLERGEHGLLWALLRWSRVGTLLAGIAVGLVAAGVFSLWHPPRVDGAALRAGMGLVPLWALMALQLALVQGTRRIALAYGPSEVMRPALAILLGGAVFLTVGRLDPLPALACFGAAILATLAVQDGALRHAFRAVPRVRAPAASGEWLRVALPLLVANGCFMVLQRVDGLVIGAFHGARAAGLYESASRTTVLATSVLLAVSAIAAPTIGALHARGDRAAVERVARTAARWMLLPSLAIAAALVVFAGPILSLWGPDFAGASTALRILVVGQLVNAAVGPVGYLLSLTGHERRVARVYAVAAALDVVLCLVLVPPLGMTGAAIATSATTVLWNLWMFVLVQKHLGIRSFAL
jgi:O-antigen/teichoic acid export membrane protein